MFSVLEKRHTKPGARENTINLIHTFRNYLHYHIKCSKVRFFFYHIANFNHIPVLEIFLTTKSKKKIQKRRFLLLFQNNPLSHFLLTFFSGIFTFTHACQDDRLHQSIKSCSSRTKSSRKENHHVRTVLLFLPLWHFTVCTKGTCFSLFSCTPSFLTSFWAVLAELMWVNPMSADTSCRLTSKHDW